MLAGLGVGTLLSFGLANREAKGMDGPINPWQYTRIDPLKAADSAYEIDPKE